MTDPIDFDSWCYQMSIDGNWKETLYHTLAAKFGATNIPENQDVWFEVWQEVLDAAISKLGG